METKKILIIEDEPQVIEVMRVTLEDFGLRVIEASNGSDAVEAAREARPDLVFLDRNLPGDECGEVCRSLQEVEAVPVVLLCDSVEGEPLEAVGAQAQLIKPFTPERLLLEVHRHLVLSLA